MANITKQKRDKMLAFLDELKQEHSDDESVRAFNEIENHLKDKKFGLVFEEHTEEVDELLKENIPVLREERDKRICCDKDAPWNFIIEGDNLQALYLLEKTHIGRVSCIYIDPPYNKGARDWKYNNDYVSKEDVYRHSKWLSLMRSRLLIAKRLLNPDDSVLIVTIDEKEYLHLGCLLEELFPEARMQMISSVISFKGSARKKQFTRLDEYLFVLEFGEASVQRLPLNDEWRINPDDMRATHLTWKYLIRSSDAGLRERSPGNFYPIFFTHDGKYHSVGEALPLNVDRNTVVAPEGTFAMFPIDKQGREHYWNINRDKFIDYKSKGYISFGKRNANGVPVKFLTSGEIEKVESGIYEIDGYDENGTIISKNEVRDIMPGTQWRITTHDATRQGTDLLTKFLKDRKFPYPKSLYAVHDVLNFFVADKPDAIILDFFSGSGTTQHAVNLLNKEDGGRRKCIMITNNELSEDEETRLTAAGYHKGDAEWERLGIARYITWPRTLSTIKGIDINGKKVEGDYISSKIIVKTKKRNFKQIDFASDSLGLKQKQQLVSVCSNGVLPKSIVTADSKYIVSADEKHTASFLFDVSAFEEWLEALDGCDYITDFYIITTKTSAFNKIKKLVNELLGDIETKENDTIPMSEGFVCNVKYFKCDWTPRKPEDYLLSNALCLHIKEMIELQNAIEIDGEKNVLILNRNDIKKNILDPIMFEKAENIWLNQSIILNLDETKLLQKKGFKYIPREFFGQELREVAE